MEAVTTSSSAPARPTTTGPLPSGGGRGVPLTPVLFILGSCFSLQFGAAIATQLFPAIGSWGTTALRLGIAALVLLVVWAVLERGWIVIPGLNG